MNQSVEEAWPLHSSFHPPLYRLSPPPPPLPSSQRQVDPYEPSVSDAAPHTSPVWGPGDRWHGEGMGWAQGPSLGPTPKICQQKKKKKEFNFGQIPSPKNILSSVIANLHIERRNNEAIWAKAGVKSHRLHTGLFQSNLEKMVLPNSINKRIQLTAALNLQVLCMPSEVRKNIHLLHRHPRLLIKSHEEQQCNSVHPSSACAFFFVFFL